MKNTANKYVKISDIVFMNIAMLIGIRWFSISAKFGASSVIDWLLATFLFFIPIALICAEFCSTFPDKPGGMIGWIKCVWGEKTAYYCSWFYYVSLYFYYPTVLTFSAIAIAYIINPALAANKTYILIFIIIGYWVSTANNLLGTKAVTKFSKYGGLLGNIIPILILLCLGAISIFILRNPIPTDFSLSHFLPHCTKKNLMFLPMLVFAMAGVELTSSFSKNMKNPKKEYPKAILISAAIVAGAYIIGTLSVLFVLAPPKIGAAKGIFSVISIVTTQLHTQWIGAVICFLIFITGITSTTVVMASSLRMFLHGNTEKFVPNFFKAKTKNNINRNALLIQGIIVTVIIIASSVFSSVQMIYSVLILMTTLLLFITYLVLFAGYFKMKFSKIKHNLADFVIPGGKFGATISGIFASGMTISIIIVIMLSRGNNSALLYDSAVIGGPILFVILGWLSYKFANKKYQKRNANLSKKL